MRKRSDGYVLVLVLVVLVVLSLAAVSVLSISLSNLESQQESIERMQDKYVAQGAVERVLTRLKAKIDGERSVEQKIKELSDTYLIETDAENARVLAEEQAKNPGTPEAEIAAGVKAAAEETASSFNMADYLDQTISDVEGSYGEPKPDVSWEIDPETGAYVITAKYASVVVEARVKLEVTITPFVDEPIFYVAPKASGGFQIVCSCSYYATDMLSEVEYISYATSFEGGAEE